MCVAGHLLTGHIYEIDRRGGATQWTSSNLWTLQVMMFFLVAAGAVLKSTGILKDDAKGILTDLVLYFFLPCNIINSFRMEFNLDILRKFAVVLAISLLVQLVCYILSKVLYNHKPKEVKRVMQYCTIVSNSGFLGLPIAQGIYGAEGMMYASIFIIPMRVMMWSGRHCLLYRKSGYEECREEAGCTSVYCGCLYRTGPDDLPGSVKSAV